MRAISRIALLGLLALSACAPSATQAPDAMRASAAPQRPYAVGNAEFIFGDDTVLQTWPLVADADLTRYARIVLQMPPQTLLATLPPERPIQIDVLAPQAYRAPARIMAANFTDWSGREGAPAGSRYEYNPHSQLLKDGGRRDYRRTDGIAGLIGLEPDGADPAPRFFVHSKDGRIDRVIECRTDVPPAKNVGEYCALRPEVGADYTYRILFPASLLTHWSEIDMAAQAYVKAVRQR